MQQVGKNSFSITEVQPQANGGAHHFNTFDTRNQTLETLRLEKTHTLPQIQTLS
jgi:hypothetical protein